MMISGFCKDVFNQPPEVCGEADRLLSLKLEGSVEMLWGGHLARPIRTVETQADACIRRGREDYDY